jgi:hypothetical protein
MMNPDFTIEELKAIHLSVITRQRVLREDWIPSERDTVRKNSLIAQADLLDAIGKKVCAAQVSKELGFYIEPLEGVKTEAA